MLNDLPGVLFGAAGVLDEDQRETVNEAVAGGTVDELSDSPIEALGGASLRNVGETLLDTLGFYFEPAGIRVEPGDIVVFDAVSPDHLVASYHERHGRQNRVPGDPGSGTGLISSPLVPVGGYWLYQFEEPGVYDLNCTVHELFGMVMRVVVTDGPGDVPEPDVDGEGRPPEDRNEIELVFGGLDPNLPSALDAFETDALSPENIVAEGEVSWEAVVDEHREES
jgi:plastocyanin